MGHIRTVIGESIENYILLTESWKSGIARKISGSIEFKENNYRDSEGHYLIVKRIVHHQDKKF